VCKLGLHDGFQGSRHPGFSEVVIVVKLCGSLDGQCAEWAWWEGRDDGEREQINLTILSHKWFGEQ
jgi:hypothetical protein